MNQILTSSLSEPTPPHDTPVPTPGDMPPNGARVLREILDICSKRKVSDIQFRTDRLLYVETHQGMEIIDSYGLLQPKLVFEILMELVRHQEEANYDFSNNNASEDDKYKKILRQLTDTKVSDFSCRGVQLNDGSLSGRLRIQAHFSSSGLGITCRILNDHIPSLDSLGFDPDTSTTLESLVVKRAGLGLVTGPTGSGKSTTLAAIMDWVRRNYPKHIVTVEDPVEYLYPDTMEGDDGIEYASPGIITQQEVGRDVNSYRQGLKDVLRKAPHIILIGEIRDREAMETCIEAAQTGHFVLSTLHTTGAVRTIGRILELFPRDKHESVLSRLSETLSFVLSQGLLNTPDGRVLTYEFLQNQDDACASAIANYHQGAGSLRDIIRRSGNIEWDSNLLSLFKQGRIDEETFVNNRMASGDHIDH